MNSAHAAREFAIPDHRVVLRFGPQQFTVNDIIDAAWFAGELAVAWRSLLAANHCEQLAAERELEAEDEILQSLSEEFRYEHDLLTSEETEKWLADRGLSEDDFLNFFLRRYWRTRIESIDGRAVISANPAGLQEVAGYSDADQALKNALAAELWLSGDFDRLAREFAWRVVSLAQLPEATQDESAIQAARNRFFERHGISEDFLLRILSQLGRNFEWFETMLAREAAYRHFLERLLTPENRGRELRLRNLGLTRVEMETLLFRTADAAREALLCLGEGETSMEELEHECGSTRIQRCVFIEDCADNMQPGLWSAGPGDCLMLQPGKDSFVVCRVTKKIPPLVDDVEIQHRIDGKLVASGFMDLAGKEIQWITAGKAWS